ncbi:MAG: DUF116 domain-containing protein [Endomicrobium sp.]|jgi:hypothetical protein|nr:DUF116 domain-containing protein [Endomicrobium sp.]
MKLCRFSQKSKECVCRIFANKQNKIQEGRFASVSFNKRLVFVPHCMRNTLICTAKEKGSYYICSGCSGCKISKINELVKKLNYKALYVLKGGRTIEKIIKEQKPKAIVGVACFSEGYQAFKILKDKNVAVQFVPLKKDGCTNTDIDMKEAEMILKYKN